MISVLAMAAVIGQMAVVAVTEQTPPVATSNVSNETVPLAVAPPAPPPPPPPPPPAPREANRKAVPASNPDAWISQYDYPPSAVRNEMSGTVGFSLNISRWGTVSECRITESSGHSLLDEETCKLMVLRGRFSPATDAASKPIPGSFSSRVNWVLPKAKPPASVRKQARKPQIPQVSMFAFPRPPEQMNANWGVYTVNDYPPAALAEKRGGRSEIDLIISKEGKIEKCSVTLSSGHADLDAKTCQMAREKLSFLPALDANGMTTKGKVKTGLVWLAAAVLPFDPKADVEVPEHFKSPIPKARAITMTYTVDENGRMKDCEATVQGDTQGPTGDVMCNLQLNPPDFYQPARDAKGNPVAVRLRMKESVEVLPLW